VDRWSQPVRNLATNPALITNTGGTTVIRTNLATDPLGSSFGSGATFAGWKNTRWFGNGAPSGTYARMTGQVDGPIPEITAYVRKTWTSSTTPTSNGDTGYEHTGGTSVTTTTNGLPITAGMTYTFSSWLRPSSAGKSGSQIQVWWHDSSGAYISTSLGTGVALTAGAWTRLSLTATAPAGAVTVGVVSDIDSGTPWAQNDYLDGAGLLIEVSTTLNPFLSGATPAAGDFTYNWQGTANASTSEQRAAVIPSTSASRSSSAGYENSKFFVFQSTAEDGKKTAKWLSPAGTPSSNWRVSAINASGPGWNYAPVKAGGRYTVMMRYRSSGWGAAQGFQIMIADGGSQNPVIGYDTTQSLNQPGWVEYRRTFTALMDATVNSCLYMAFPVIPQTATDGIFEIREWMLVEGEYTGDFIDGTKPLSKWDGTANASTSVGYPPQLLDLAGKPELDYSAPGTFTLNDSYGLQEGRTFYTVFENLTELTSGAISSILQYGDSALNDVVANTYLQVRQDTHAAPGNQLFIRRTGAQGAISTGTITARYVACWGVTSTGIVFLSVNGGTRGTDPTAVQMSIPHQKLLISTDDAMHKHFRTLLYRGEHDTATRTAISRYLGNKYGANVA
jgi:hypothetical protein